MVNSPRYKTRKLSEGEDDVDSHTRESWNNPCEFLLSCLGCAVGFGNIWRFPFLCYKNGGAVFLIPYFIMLLITGLPMFFLELALGQYVSLGPIKLFQEMSPICSGVGWGMVATSVISSIYYNMMFAWTLFYTFASLTSVLPWSSCENDFNTKECFRHEDSHACNKINMYYYNKTCHSVEDFCSISGLESYNETHCFNDVNQTSIMPAKEAVYQISSSEDYYKNRMLGVTGTTWSNMGGLRWELVGCLALAWVIVCICMMKGIKSSGKVVYVTATFPYLVLLILFIRGITLEGAYKGIEFYILKPNITKLSEMQVWYDAATQIFYSLSTGIGSLIALSSYSKFQSNCMRHSITITFANSVTSLLAGFVIFSILGFMAAEINAPIEDVVDSGFGLIFIAYPAALARMPFPPLWSLLFFTMLITLGVDTQFAILEPLLTGIFDQFKSLRRWKTCVMMVLCFTLFVLGLPLCLNGGVYMFDLLNYYGGISLIFVAIGEVVCVGYIYGFKKFMNNITADMKIYVPGPLYIYWGATWLVLAPLTLIFIFGFAIYNFQPARYGSYIYPDSIQVLGWLSTGVSMACIPVLAVYMYFRSGKKGKALIEATEEFCPAYLRKKKGQELYAADIEGVEENEDAISNSQ